MSIPQTLIDLILPGNVPLITGNVYRHGHIYQNTYYFVICGNTQQLALMTKTECGYETDDTETGIAGTHPFPSREDIDLHATIFSYCGCTPECTSVNPPADLTPYQNTTIATGTMTQDSAYHTHPCPNVLTTNS